MSKTQIDRLGDRLKLGPHTDEDLELLDRHRQSFFEAYEFVLKTIRQHGAFPTGRAKVTHSIVEKLRRESLRLSQMQDIAGCRVVVNDILAQDQFVVKFQQLFPNATVIDRRQRPSHGYRAVHLIVEISSKSIEVQVRTALQHGWPERSEKASDAFDSEIKYGGGPEELRSLLLEISNSGAIYEKNMDEQSLTTYSQLLDRFDSLVVDMGRQKS